MATSAPPAAAATAAAPVVLLTRDVHQHGPWLTDFDAALARRNVPTIILPISEFRGADKRWRCLINRVSDAAPPQDVKLTLAALRSAELAGIPTLNGVSSFAMATSKLLHYELFESLGLATPPYVTVRESTGPNQLLGLAHSASLTYPLLLKPNAGGFGNGIVRIETADEIPALFEATATSTDAAGAAAGVAADDAPLPKRAKNHAGAAAAAAAAAGAYERSSTTQAPTAAVTTSGCGKAPKTGAYVAPLTTHRAGPSLAGALGDDGVALLQECVAPDGGFTYRVFFQGSAIQCGVRVTAVSFNACVRSVPHQAWVVPSEIQADVLAMVAKAGADMGSVEFFYRNGVANYFDFNLLSTLPTAHGAGTGFDPYDDLTKFVLESTASKPN